LSIGLSLTGLLAVPRFEELFASFGSKLSTDTILAIRISKWLWVATIIALYLLYVWRKSLPQKNYSETKFTVAFVLLIFVDVSVFIYVIRAMYLAIFDIG
jgi:type II secretory pathway component PulF